MAGYDGSIRIRAILESGQFDTGINGMNRRVKQFGSTLARIAGYVGVAFGTAALVNFSREAVKAASALNDAWIGLQSIIEGQGRSFSRAKGFINDYIADGLVPLENAVTAYKNLAARGYSTEQIEQLMDALKNSAAFGRQSSYTLGEAVQTATEGLKNENSILVDNAGVTKNVSVMWKEYAKSIGVGVNSLTLAQKRQAEVNGIMQETRFQTGDAAKLTTTYSGQVSALSFNFQQLKVQVGNAMIPMARAVLPSINAIIVSLTKLASVFAEVTARMFGRDVGRLTDTENQLASSGSAAADAADKLAGSTSGVGNAAKEAEKEMKGVLAGFDELNILADNTASSLEGASGGLDNLELPSVDSDGELWGDMTLNPDLSAEVYALKKKLEDLIPLISGIASGLLAWKIAGSLIPDLGVLQGLLGSLMITAGVTLLVDSIKDILFGDGLTWENILKGGAGGALAGGGLGLMLAKKLGLTWAKGMLGGAVIGLGVALLLESIADIITKGLNIGNGILGAIGGAIAGAAAGALYMGGPGGALLGAGIGLGVALLLESIADIITDGLNIGNGLLGLVGGAIAGAAAGFYLGGPSGAVLGAIIGVGVSLLLESIGDILFQGSNIGNNLLGLIGAAIAGAVAGFAVGGPLGTVLGVYISVGLTLALQSAIAQISSGFDLGNAIKMVIGTTLAGAGMGFALGGPVGAGIGAVIGLVAGIALEITGVKLHGKAIYEATEDFQTMTRVIDECEDSANRSSSAMETLGRNVDNLKTSLSDAGAAQALADEIYAINNDANASAYELEQMATKVEILNGMGLEDLHLTIDETTGRVIETKEATDQLIESIRKEAETAALQQLLVDAYKGRYQAVVDAEEAVKKVDAAELALMQTEKDLTNTPWWDFDKHAALRAQQEKQTEALESATGARDKAIGAYEDLGTAIDTYSGALTDLEEPESNVGVTLESRMDSVRQTLDKAADDMPEYGRNIGEGLEQGMSEGVKEQETKNIFQRFGDWFKELFGIHSPSKVFKEYGDFLINGLYNGVDETIPSVKELLSGFLQDTKSNISNAWLEVNTDTSNKWDEISRMLSGKYSDIDRNSGTGFEGIRGTIAGKINDTMEDLKRKDWISVGSGIVNGILDGLSNIFGKLKDWASNVWDNITGVFTKNNAKASVTNSANKRNASVSGRDAAIARVTAYSAAQLPHLANGAVIPPNQQFAAILGDQRSGYNVEAPLATIEKAVENAISRMGGFGGEINITVESVLDGKVVAKNTVRHINAMTRSSGRPVLLT